MYRDTSRQVELFVQGHQLHPSALSKLQSSWAKGFRDEILPLLLEFERKLAVLYHEDNGRPNWSVARMLGLSLLKEWFDVTDRELEAQLCFDLRFQYALDLVSEQAYLSRRSLENFRYRLQTHDPDGLLLREFFDELTKRAIKKLKLNVSSQRLDSTHVESNIRTRGQVELFRRTIDHFLDQLEKKAPEHYGTLDGDILKWRSEKDQESWFGKGGPKVALEKLAQWAVNLHHRFAQDKDSELTTWESFKRVAELVSDYCVIGSDDDGSSNGAGGSGAIEGSGGDTPVTVPPSTSAKSQQSSSAEDEDSNNPESAPLQPSEANNESSSSTADAPQCTEVLRKGRRGGNSLQSPHDPDAGYGHKGVGYSVQVSETCNNENGVELITDYEIMSASNNDWGKSNAVLSRLNEKDLDPDDLYADAGYPTADALLAAQIYGCYLYAPVTPSSKKEVIGRESFVFDDDGLVVECPCGHRPIRHGRTRLPGCDSQELHAFFDGNVCRSCKFKGTCVARGNKTGSWWVRIEPRLVLRDRRLQEQQSSQWWKGYSIRSGIEATMSELKRAHGLGHLRVRGSPAVTMAVSLKVTACNAKRMLSALSAPTMLH